MRGSLVLVSIIVGIVIVELIWQLLLLMGVKGVDFSWERRYMLLTDRVGGSVFQNFDQWFLYEPKKYIKSATYYDTNAGWVKEYEYTFRTNNLGVVQTADIDLSKESVLVLGDSLTEGQGAPPWFEDFYQLFQGTEYQGINGGILGTGFEAWNLLHDHLRGAGVKISKLVVVFISDDYDRIPWIYPKHALACVGNYANCKGDEGIYGMPPDSEIFIYLERLKDGRMKRNSFLYPMKASLKSLFGASYMTTKLIKLGVEKKSRSFQKTRSAAVIRRLIDTYGKEVLFIHLPQKDELMSGISGQGMEVRRAIQAEGGRLFDGFAWCDLTLEDYHLIDPHPNEGGYRKISGCVSDAVKAMMASDLKVTNRSLN